ncbi:MAG: hypothetical protein IPJ15_10440 [Actinomycetales bacterium]|nr:hypothetical protein [Candidatus Phosphoribacter baldrii]
MSPRTPRRLGSLPAALVGLLVAALLTGCGAGGRPGTAVVVGDRLYTPAQVIEATAQINTALAGSGDAATESQVVNLLVLNPFVVPHAMSNGLWVPDNQYNSFVGKIHNPTPTTVEALQANSAFFALDEATRKAVLADLKAASIQIDPRYGSIDLTTGFLAMPNPDWIVRTVSAADK